MRAIEEVKKMVVKKCEDLFEEFESSANDLRDLPNFQASDTYEIIHLALIKLTQLNQEAGFTYRKALRLQQYVEESKLKASAALKDAEMATTTSSSFRPASDIYLSRVEVEGKLRSRTFEENYDMVTWTTLASEVYTLVRIIQSYQADTTMKIKAIDARLRILSMA